MTFLYSRKSGSTSAVLPGLGQAYNKRYWKIPLVYGAIGTSLYFYLDNNKNTINIEMLINAELEGYSDDDYAYLDNNRLIAGQTINKRPIYPHFVVAFYALNIIDANVDAALLQFNVDENLSVRPVIYPNDVTFKTNVGLTFNY
jgi:hypothetical protein